MTVKRTVRDADGTLVTEEEFADEHLPISYVAIAMEFLVDHLTIRRIDGSTETYRRVIVDHPVLELSAEELLREHGIRPIADVIPLDPDAALDRLEKARGEFQAVVDARREGLPVPPTPTLDAINRRTEEAQR